MIYLDHKLFQNNRVQFSMKSWQTLALATFAALSAQHSANAEYIFPGERSHCHGFLMARQSDARITLRSGPGTNHRSLGYGLVGDSVYILWSQPPELDYATDSQGNTWYRVGFYTTGAKGWVREDFIQMRCSATED